MRYGVIILRMGLDSRKVLVAVLLLFVTPLGVAQPRYFPAHSFSENEWLDTAKTGWYSEQLRALQEPSLLDIAQNKSAQSYRFLWLRSFDHPIAIRLDIRADGSGELSTKIASGSGGYRPGHLTENLSRPLLRQQVQTVATRINSMQFWSLGLDDKAGDDGAQWIIEGVKDGKYHLVDRWSPKDGQVRELGLMLLDMANLKIPAKDVY